MCRLSLFPDLADVPIGDELDRCYTPDALAVACVARASIHLETWPSIVYEPSVGGGAFVRAVRRRWYPSPNGGPFDGPWIEGWDIDSGAAGLGLVDAPHAGSWLTPWPEVGTPKVTPADLVIGNPAFSDETAIAHVERALECRAPTGVVALILPWSFLGGVERWLHLTHGAHRPIEVAPIVPRPWPSRVRETALYIWRDIRPDHVSVTTPIRWRKS